MKLTKQKLKQLIKEQISSMNEYGQYGTDSGYNTPGVNWEYDPSFVDHVIGEWEHEFSLSEEATLRVKAALESVYDQLAQALFPEEFKAHSKGIRESKQNK